MHLLVHSNDWSEKPLAVRNQIGKDELKSEKCTPRLQQSNVSSIILTVKTVLVPGVVAFGKDVERLGDVAQLGVDGLGRDVQHAVVANG